MNLLAVDNFGPGMILTKDVLLSEGRLLVGDEPFEVLLADDLIQSEVGASSASDPMVSLLAEQPIFSFSFKGAAIRLKCESLIISIVSVDSNK